MPIFIPKIPFEILLVSEIQYLQAIAFADKETEAQWGWVTAKGRSQLTA